MLNGNKFNEFSNRRSFILVYYGANGTTIVDEAVFTVVATTIEVEIVHEVTVALVLRTSPVIATRSLVVNLRPVAVTRSGKKN